MRSRRKKSDNLGAAHIFNTSMTRTLGIDGGGSKTETAVIEGSKVVAIAREGGSNQNYIATEQLISDLRRSLEKVFQTTSPDGIRRVGISVLASSELVMAEVRRFAPAAEFLVYSEPDIAFAQCGWYERRGVSVTAGTGSSFGGFRDGRHLSVGGLGALLGDEGSGFDLAIRGIKAALRAKPSDGRGPATELSERMFRHFQLKQAWDIVTLSCQTPIPRTLLASFAVEVVGAAENGDAVAAQICERIAESLAGDALHLCHRLFQSDEVFPVALAGGVLQGSRLINHRVTELVLNQFPKAEVRIATTPPAVAAARLAEASVEGKMNRRG